ncbi:MAG: protocatechuate 3,4-dioxygenase [Bryobacteraceae bacterium]
MARITLGLGTSHGPMLSIGSEHWGDRLPFDKKNPSLPYRGKTYTFPELAELRRAEQIEAQIEPEEAARRHARCQTAILSLAESFDNAKLDVVVIVGNDQMEVFSADHVPGFAIFWGDYLEGHPRSKEFLAKLDPAIARAELDRTPAQDTKYPCSPALGRHLVERVVTDGFDVSQLKKLSAGELGVSSAPHAYGFVYRRIMRDKVPPHVPVFINTFYPPNQPTAGRCFDFGRALGRAIQSWPEDLRVGVIASGGLTHFVIDEAFDAQLLDAMLTGNAASLANVGEEMFQSGTSEVKNWIAVAGIMAEAGLKMRLVDYVPCYRSEAGTGSAMGFACWE